MRIWFYKGTRPAFNGVYNRGIRIITKSVYSHAEIQFSDGMSASSSLEDGGVRFKAIDYNPDHWDYIELPDALFEEKARAWFIAHDGHKYDILGNIHFIFSVVGDDKYKWFCSEAIGTALGIPNAWRLDPGSLYQVVSWMSTKLQQQSALQDLELGSGLFH